MNQVPSALKRSSVRDSESPRRRKNSAGSAHSGLSRRQFVLTTASAAAGFTIVPRHVLGGPGFVAPSDKITLAYIGCGTQGLREMLPMLQTHEIQIVAACAQVREGQNHVDWA